MIRKWREHAGVKGAGSDFLKRRDAGPAVDVHANQITVCNTRLLESSSQVFSEGGTKADSSDSTAIWLKIANLALRRVDNHSSQISSAVMEMNASNRISRLSWRLAIRRNGCKRAKSLSMRLRFL